MHIADQNAGPVNGMRRFTILFIEEWYSMKHQFTHIDANGNAVMVDVGGKEITARSAVAVGRISIHILRVSTISQP